MKLLYIYTETEHDINEHIINFLKNNGVEVTLAPLKLSNSQDADLKKFVSAEYQKEQNKIGYDFILWAVHSATSWQLRNFQQQVKPKIGHIDLEHDLFVNDLPEHSLVCGKSLLVTFQKRHYDMSIKHLSNGREIINARWPKLDIKYKTLTFSEIDPWNDVILIGTGIWQGKNFANLPLFSPFRKVWYKKYVNSWTIKGINSLLDPFTGPSGSKYCADACKFFMTIGSSCYQDALLFGSIPILMPAPIIKQEPIDDIISVVTIKQWMPPGVAPFKAITTENLEEKLTCLRNDHSLYKNIHRELFLEWFDSDYFALPTAHEVIWDFIKENSWKI